MYSGIRLIIAAAVVFILCRTVADQGHATVVQGGEGGPVNPAVEAGGQAPTKLPPYTIPYSLIGALRGEEALFSSYYGWPWTLFRSFHWHWPHARTSGGNGVEIGPVNEIRRPVR